MVPVVALPGKAEETEDLTGCCANRPYAGEEHEHIHGVGTDMKQVQAAPDRPPQADTGAPPGLELRHLRCFVALADAGSFTHAAERIFIAQPTLSQRIQQLEQMIRHAAAAAPSRGPAAHEGGRGSAFSTHP